MYHYSLNFHSQLKWIFAIHCCVAPRGFEESRAVGGHPPDQHLIGNPRLNISRRLFCSAVYLLRTTQEVSGSIPGRSSFFLCLFSAKSCKVVDNPGYCCRVTLDNEEITKQDSLRSMKIKASS